MNENGAAGRLCGRDPEGLNRLRRRLDATIVQAL